MSTCNQGLEVIDNGFSIVLHLAKFGSQFRYWRLEGFTLETLVTALSIARGL